MYRRMYLSMYLRLSFRVFRSHRMAFVDVLRFLTVQNKTPCGARGLASNVSRCHSGGHGIRTHNPLRGT